MATVSKWTPFGVALDVTATGGTVTRTSATQFTVVINASWETYYSGAQTNYGMTASSGGKTATISAYNGSKRSSGSTSFTGTYSISGNGTATKTITVTFRNFNDDNGDSATKAVSFNVSVPAWTSYKITYHANGGSGAPSAQTKWKDQALTLSSTKPTRTGYSFLGWSTSSTATSATYSAGGSYTSNAAATLYAVWKANTYTVKYNANGGTGAPANQTKTYGKTLTLSSTKPTRTNYTFKGWSTSANATTATYAAGGNYTANAGTTLYAVWELSYIKPKITTLTASRCNSSGTVNDEGTYSLIKCNWSTSLSVSSIKITWVDSAGGNSGSATVTASGTSGSVSEVVDGSFDVETSYTFTITVTDANGSTDRSVTMSGSEYIVDYGRYSVAVGKPAETLKNASGGTVKVFDSKWLGRFRNHLCVGDKIGYNDGNTGLFVSYEGFIQLQRSSAQGYHPYIGFYIDDATSGAQVRLNSSTNLMEFLGAAGYKFNNNMETSGDLTMNTDKTIFGIDPDGLKTNAFTAQNDNGNTIVGYGNYVNANGNTNIYGHDLNFGVSNMATPGTFRPYRRRGDSMTITLRTAGYVTNGKTDVIFWIPMAEPIVGSPTATLTSGSGFIIRQGDKYTHGSAADTYVKPTSYEAVITPFNGIYAKAVFSNTANVVNNDTVGIYWNGTITFS